MIEILVSLISGGLTLVGVICTNAAANRRIAAKIQTAQAVTDTKLESLTHEVRQHNHFASRIPALEAQVQQLSQRILHLEQEGIKK